MAEGDNRTLKDFVAEKRAPNAHGKVTENDTERRENGEVHFDTESIRGDGKSFFIQTYGCQMNVSDTEIVRSVLEGAGYDYAASLEEANVVLLNTCAIREKAETRIWGRLAELKGQNLKRKKADKQTVGLLGCMAERLKEKVLDKSEVVDVVAGPDAYRDLPHLLAAVSGEDRAAAAVNVQLSVEETYGDIAPVRDSHSSVSAFTSIQRGCNNMCAFCIVPFTRGRERSRALDSIVAEVESLSNQGYREVTLLGQNVNSYFDRTRPSSAFANADPLSSCSVDSPARGFVNMYKLRDGDGYRFGDLLRAVAEINPEMRVRFTSPHPKDFQDDVLDAIASYSNICKGKYIVYCILTTRTHLLIYYIYLHTCSSFTNLSHTHARTYTHTQKRYICLYNQVQPECFDECAVVTIAMRIWSSFDTFATSSAHKCASPVTSSRDSAARLRKITWTRSLSLKKYAMIKLSCLPTRFARERTRLTK